MFLNKIKTGVSGILTYGITPPKEETSTQRIAEIAEKTVARIKSLDLDALIVYDVQDESARTASERPFPFLKALDPFDFAQQYLQQLPIPKIIYRPAGKYRSEELSTWLNKLNRHNFFPVFVGLPAPDFPVKTSLPEAYKLWSQLADQSVMGAVTIPERHAALNDEDKRILDKQRCGVSYFISQCIFDVDYAKQLIEDLCYTCKKENKKIPTLLFTLSVCGSEKTLRFMEWLGIHIPQKLKKELLESADMLKSSVNICLAIASTLMEFCTENSVPFGLNIESVAIRKDEIEASIYIVEQIAAMLDENGIRASIISSEKKDTGNRFYKKKLIPI
ncbi:hypothetical protein RYH73_25420 [Olivibacter sp. CPCC 100613]|uniref:methylenetetrahydrofolate reductase n=1 Tax=Olivibacter sp. CPCC 100613 TaxID=3079931 RepID=UPI002FFAC6A6